MIFKKSAKKIYLFFFDMLASIAVFFDFNWPEAYRFVGYKHLGKYKKLVFISKGDSRKVQAVQRKIITFLEKYVSFEPKQNKVREWIDANFRLSSTFLSIPEAESIARASLVAQRVDQFRKSMVTKYKISEPDVAFIPRPLAEGSLGVYENLESLIKAMSLGMAPQKELFFIVDSRTKVNNPCYLNYWAKHVKVVTDDVQIKSLVSQEQYLTIPMLGIFKQYGNKSLLMHIALGMVREQWIREKRPPLLSLTKEDKQRGWDCLKSLGVPEGAWFVGLHVRAPGWRDKSAEVENVRNADIKTYFAAIKSITDAGGWVIRLGDSISMKPLPAMDKVIDYANSDLKNDWMDIFLCSQCRFLIGTASGLYTVAEAFGVPCIMTNLMGPNNMFALTSQDIVLTKLCKTKVENRYLPFKELVAPPVGIAVHAYEDMGLEVVDNTSDEIKGAVDEMLARFSGTLEYSEGDESLQNNFKSIVKDCSQLYGDKDIQLYARMGRDFLRNHADLLSLEEVEC